MKRPIAKENLKEERRRGFIALSFVICLLLTSIMPFLDVGQQTGTSLPPVDSSTYFQIPKPKRSDEIYVVNCSALSRSEKFTLVSLQGITNRETARLYLNFDTPERADYSWLSPCLDFRKVSYGFMDFNGALGKFGYLAGGLVVYDDKRQDTINLATTLAGLNDWLICDASHVDALAAFNLAVKQDLTSGEWTGFLLSSDFYLKAFEMYYPLCNQSCLAMLDPYFVATRDWVVARRLFCYYLSPGPIAEPGQVDAFNRILKETPKADSMIGWMRWDIGIEENSGMQAISKAGKVLWPCENSPNLSFLSAFQMQGPTRTVVESTTPSLAPSNKTYVSFLMSDGDNTDYLYAAMRERWASPDRGKVPVGWSMPPALCEIAPALMEYYYKTASPNDTFLAGSSGAAIMYPDFFPRSRMPAFLNRSRGMMDQCGLESVWLINSYTAQETYYSPVVLSDYVDYLKPSGIFLDYGDVPTSSPFWIQNGKLNSGVPVIRSLHMWGSRENLLAKLQLDAQEHTSGPFFVFVTVHTWTMNLTDVVEVVRTLNATSPNSAIRIVPPATLLRMIQSDSVNRAGNALDVALGSRVLTSLASGELSDLQLRISEARSAVAAGDYTRAAGTAYVVYRRSTDLHGQEETAYVAIIIVVIVLTLILILFIYSRRLGLDTSPGRANIAAAGLMLASTHLFFRSQLEILFGYSWDWLAYAAVIPAALGALPFSQRGFVTRASPSGRMLAATTLMGIGTCFQIVSPWFGSITTFGFIWLVKELGPRFRGTGERVMALVGAFTICCAIYNALPLSQVATIAGIPWVFFFALWTASRPGNHEGAQMTKKERKFVDSRFQDSYPLWMPAAFLALTTITLYLTKKHYLMLRFESSFSLLLNLGIVVPIGSLVLSSLAYLLLSGHRRSIRTIQPPLIIIIGASWLGVAWLPNPLIASLCILLSQTAMLLLVLTTMGAFMDGTLGEKRFPWVVRNLVLLFIVANFLLLLPIVSYNLLMGKLSLSFNYLMYAFPLEFALFTFVGVFSFALATYHFHSRDRPEEK